MRLVPDKQGGLLFHGDVFRGDGHENMDGALHAG